MFSDLLSAVRGDLLLCDPARGVLEAPSGIIPGGAGAPPGVPPLVEGACDGLMDSLQLVLTHLQPATDGRNQGRPGRSRDEERPGESSSRPADAVVGLSLVSQVQVQSLQLLDGVFSEGHVALHVTGGPALHAQKRRRA